MGDGWISIAITIVVATAIGPAALVTTKRCVAMEEGEEENSIH
jgi:hypothetical protein